MDKQNIVIIIFFNEIFRFSSIYLMEKKKYRQTGIIFIPQTLHENTIHNNINLLIDCLDEL